MKILLNKSAVLEETKLLLEYIGNGEGTIYTKGTPGAKELRDREAAKLWGLRRQARGESSSVNNTPVSPFKKLSAKATLKAYGNVVSDKEKSFPRKGINVTTARGAVGAALNGEPAEKINHIFNTGKEIIKTKTPSNNIVKNLSKTAAK